MRNSLALSVLVFLAQPASAQEFHWGLKGGIPLTDPFRAEGNSILRTSYGSNPNRYIVGPMIEIGLPWRLSLEVDGLYSRQHFRKVTILYDPEFLQTGLVDERTTANSWEVPFLLKYRPSDRPLRAFVEVGGTLQTVSGLRHTRTTRLFGDPVPPPEVTTTNHASELRHDPNPGFVMGAGIEFRVKSLRVSPGFRSILWRFRTFRSLTYASPDSLLSSEQSPVQFMMGITF